MRRLGTLLAAVIAATTPVLAVSTGTAWAAVANPTTTTTTPPPPNGPLTLSLVKGPVGTTFTASQDVEQFCPQWFVTWDNPGASSAVVATGPGFRSVGFVVPDASDLGPHKVTSFCSGGRLGNGQVGSATFTVTFPPFDSSTTTAPPTTAAPTTTAPPTTPPTVATTPPTNATTRATTPTTRPSNTTAGTTPTTASPTTVAETTVPETTIAETTVAETTIAGSASTVATQAFKVDRPAAEPGGEVHALGEGCTPNARVDIEVAGAPAGETQAGQDGRFSAPLQLPVVAPGRLEVTARCGPTLLTTVDIVLASRVDPGTSTLAVLVLFVLLALALFRRRLLPARKDTRPSR